MWIQYIGPPLLMVLGGIITWLMKARSEELRATEEKLRDTRHKIYADILAPYIKLFSDMSTKGQENVMEAITSEKYRKITFDLNLYGSDEVVRAYNSLLSHTYAAVANQTKNPKEMLRLWGDLLLQIRKSLGNKGTKLDEFDMLRGMIKDIDTIR